MELISPNMNENKIYDNSELQGDTLKILHLTSAFFPEYSGTTTRLYNLLSNLPYEIILITSDGTIKGDIIKSKEEYFGNIRVKRVQLYSNYAFCRKAPLRYMYTIYQRPRILFNSAKSEQFNIIHAHNPSLFAQAAERLSRESNKPFIMELHVIGQDYYSGINRNIKTFYTERMTEKLLKSCNHIIALTQEAVPQINYRILLYIKRMTVSQHKSKVHDTQRGNMNKNLNTR